MAPGVAKSYAKIIEEYLTLYDIDPEVASKVKEFILNQYKEFNTCLSEERINEMRGYLNSLTSISEDKLNHIIDFAFKKLEKEVYQGMQIIIHNLNSMASRAGSQVPFSSLNYGTDTTVEGRMVTKQILLALDDGLGGGETPIFPIHIFKCKHGINFDPGDPNYDLYKLSLKVSAKRLFPNWSFIDAPYNLQYYVPGNPDTEIAVMGCRTRVAANNYDPTRQVFPSRGNISFTTINLPRLAILHRNDINGFYQALDETIELVFEQLLERFSYQSKKKVRNYPFLMGEGIWMDSEKLDYDDEIGEVIKHGTLTVGFIGLAETLVGLTGKHHGESPEAQKLGLEIIQHMRDKCDAKAKETKLNFSLIASPAEGLCLDGNTLVQTINGNKPIKDIKVGELLFTYNEKTRSIEIDEVVKSGMTKIADEVIKVTFDTGQEIICTPNHPFARRKLCQDKFGKICTINGTNETIEWVNAEDLRIGMRIASGYIITSISGHRRYCQFNKSYLHRLIWEYFSGEKIPEGYIVHHKDGNKLNNTFSNLECISNSDHKRIHLKETIYKYQYKSEDVIGEKNPFYGKKHSDYTKSKISLAKRSKCNFKGERVDPSIFVDEYYNGSSINEIANKYGYTYYTMRSRLLEQGVEFRKNHKVTKIERIKTNIPVYDLTMKNNHNFFVGGDQGILVHNSGRFVKIDKQKFGIIEGITDKEYYTNSMHVMPGFNISAFKKIKIEAPYHAMCNGGVISYIELDGDPRNNIEALDALVHYACENEMNYFAINHDVDICPLCGYTGIIGDTCPRCGRKDGEGIDVEKYNELAKQYHLPICRC